MAAPFLDIALPASIWGYPCSASPRFSTTVARSDSGDEQRNRNRMHPLHTYRIPQGVRDRDVLEDLRDHWMVMAGPLTAFAWRDPTDFAGRYLDAPNVVPVIAPDDQVIGTGDGATTGFQLVRTYVRGAASYVRPIRLPVVASVRVAVDGTEMLTGWSVSRIGGVVEFDAAPADGAEITAGFLFDVPVRFASDEDFDAIVQSFEVDGFSDLTLMETMLCEGA